MVMVISLPFLVEEEMRRYPVKGDSVALYCFMEPRKYSTRSAPFKAWNST